MPSLPNEGFLVSFDLENTAALAYLETRPYAFAGESVDSLLRSLRNTWGSYLSQGIREGMTINQLTEEVERVFRGTDKIDWWRARRIARTESVGAANMGTNAAYKQANVPYKTWVTMRDGLVRNSHRPMDLVSVPTVDKFRLPTGVEGEGPGDPNMGPREICNCRCTILADYAPPSPDNNRTATFKR